MKKLEDGQRFCKHCSKTKSFIFSKNRGKCRIFADYFGNYWEGSYCPECKIEKHIKINRSRGFGTIDQVTAAYAVKGRQAEHSVRRFFEHLGYTVKMTTTKGPDLTCTRDDGFYFSVEVKSIIRHSIARCFYVSAVSEKRKKDDFIAFVEGDKKIFIEPMIHHLKKCSKGGNRCITQDYGHFLKEDK